MIQKKRPIPSGLWVAALAIILSAAVSGCAGSQRTGEMKPQDQFNACPDRPNCVSSEAQDPRRAVASMQLAGNSGTEWAEVQAVVRGLPRSTIVTATERYLHVTLRSSVFGFIDDLELKLDPQTKRISIRSASRSGYYDFGVNRRRIEELRKQLKAAALIR